MDRDRARRRSGCGILLIAALWLCAANPARAAQDDACSEDDWRAPCIADRAFDAIAGLPADERPGVLGTLLVVHVGQNRAAPAGLLAMAHELAWSGSPSERLQVLFPLAEMAHRAGEKKQAARLQRQGRNAVEALLRGRPGRPPGPQAYLQIADTCIGLAEMRGGAPVLVPPWAEFFRRHCVPRSFARLKASDGFSRVVHRHLQLVAHYLVQDRKSFADGLPEMILTLRAVNATMRGAAMEASEREAGLIVSSAMLASLGALACDFQFEAECRAALGSVVMPEEVADPQLWSSWAAVEAVRGEGLALANRPLEGVAALNWLLARAAEPERKSHRAAFLASASWLSARLQAIKAGRRMLQAT